MTDAQAASRDGSYYKADFFSQPGGCWFKPGSPPGIEIGGGIWGKLGWIGPIRGGDLAVATVNNTQPADGNRRRMYSGEDIRNRRRDPDRMGYGWQALSDGWNRQYFLNRVNWEVLAREVTGDEMLGIHKRMQS